MTAEKVQAGIAVAMRQFAERGWEADLGLIRPGPTPLEGARQFLRLLFSPLRACGGFRSKFLTIALPESRPRSPLFVPAVGVAGNHGSVWVDAETLDLVRVDFKVNRIPTYLGVCLVEESLHYKKLTIGTSENHLPDHSELAAADDQGYAP